MMTTLAINYIVNPFSNILKTFKYAMELAGMARAARELYRLGYYKDYERIMNQMRKIQAER
jgi:hypothetical protein